MVKNYESRLKKLENYVDGHSVEIICIVRQNNDNEYLAEIRVRNQTINLEAATENDIMAKINKFKEQFKGKKHTFIFINGIGGWIDKDE